MLVRERAFFDTVDQFVCWRGDVKAQMHPLGI